MSERTLKQLVGALTVVVGVWIVGTLFSGGSGSIAASGSISNVFDGLDGVSLQSMRMVNEGSSVELTRSGDGWTANGFPADPAAVSRLLDILPDLEIGDLTASNPDNHDRMGVSVESAVTVTFTVGGDERALLVGKSGRRFGTAYVRLPGEDDVYLLDGDLRAQLTRDLDSWRDRTMVRIDSAAVARIVVQRGTRSYALERGDTAWTFADGGPAQAPVVNGILAELSALVATGFLADTDSIAELDLEMTTTALSASGEVLAEIRLGSGDGDRWGRTLTDDYLYRVTSFRAGRVAPAQEDVEPGS